MLIEIAAYLEIRLMKWNAAILVMCAAWCLALAIVTAQPFGGLMSVIRSPTAAAWAQAIFGGLAIFAAFIVGRSQMKSAEQLADRQRRAVGNAMRLSMTQATGYLQGVIDVIELPLNRENIRGMTSFIRQLDQVTTSAAGLPVHEADDLELLGRFRLLMNMAANAKSRAEQTMLIVSQHDRLPSEVVEIWRKDAAKAKRIHDGDLSDLVEDYR